MIEEFHYKVNMMDECLDKCPYKKETMIGSSFCRESCEYQAYSDMEEGVVYCWYKCNLKDSEKRIIRKRKGFKITINDITYFVYFKIINNWKTICTIIGEFEIEFKGISKCNFKEGDVFNESDGKVLAFEKAFEKLQKYLIKQSCEIQKSIERENSMVLKGINYKFDKMIKRGQL
ncbi:MAG: hypothetical protein WC438_06015 [Candidatus Pacearchaeota archaeon]